jgi:phage I-like protein
MTMAKAERDAAALPQWIRLLPLGRVDLVDRREPLEVDEESLEAMVRDFRSRGVDLVIDYEHQSLLGERAPAAGWIKDLEARDDGLWARVEWTPQAQEYLRGREYRYFSPVLRLHPETRRPLVLLHVGLTNVPAIKGLTPLVAKMGTPDGASLREETGKMGDRLKRILNLDPEAAEAAVWDRVLEVFQDLALTLKLPREASVSQLKGAVEALKAGAEGLVEAQEELKHLRYRLAEVAAAQAVAEAMKAGKVSPAQKGWAYEYFRQDPEGFKTYVARAPKLVPTGEELPRFREGQDGGGNLLPEELALCRALNVPPEEYLKAKAQSHSAN